MIKTATSSTVVFKGKSGQHYRFSAWAMGTRFKPIGGIYIVSKRECLDRTFPSRATHRCLAIGETADLSASRLAQTELAALVKQGANCVCVFPVAEPLRRAAIEQDLVDGNERWTGQLHYLFRTEVPPLAPEAYSADSTEPQRKQHAE